MKSALREAFAKIGIHPEPQREVPPMRRPPESELRESSAPLFFTFTDEQLAASIYEIETAMHLITAQLDFDLEQGCQRGMAWRNAAGRARAHKKAHLKLARAEEAQRRAERKAKEAEDLRADRDYWRARAEYVATHAR